MRYADRAADDVEPGDLPGIPRPRETQALVGHEAAAAAFGAAIAEGRLHHAWLIGGAPGIGKATLAYRVARRLLAYPAGGGPAGLDVPEGDPVAGKVAGLSHPNLVALRRHRTAGAKALPTKISVDMVRRALDLFASTATDSGWRVCILDSAEDLNANAANALLKVLEEPPPRALFLILAHQPGRLLPTIRSRCRALMLRPLAAEAVARVVRGLPEPFPQPDEAALARAVAPCEGSVARALAMLDPVTAGLVAEVETLLARARTPDWGRVLKLAETLAGRDAEARFEAAQDAVQRFVSAELHRRRDEPPARLAALVEVAERFGRAARDAAIYNLDRRPVVLSLFGDLAEAP
ncbi:DNA polymerase III subunit delta' [Methylobacterium sp. NEAU K]|uniref:DNA polymerase III subunit delta' n=1 Tax=Methylobacterium sp. NEAU K TaxID=3064946 RepID=UPI0027324A22|nr:DNA polymerase III subunit delta' [Methylobacterium sp. NEAU K]MDP4006295.1 DNA polymerase III subunit delta' [Methylobacterium sp. NEAU K]